MVVLIIVPVFEWNRRLPFFTYLPFGMDIDKENNFIFGFVYMFQVACAVYAGGSNIMVNMYTFSILVCVNFFLLLFSSRIKRLGYSGGYSEHWTDLPHNKISYYNELIHYINMHLKIDA